MSRLSKLRRAGVPDEAAEQLAALPADTVDLIAVTVRRRGRDALEDDRARRARNRSNRRRYRWTDSADVAEGGMRLIGGLAGRGTGGDLEAATLLYSLQAETDLLLRDVVAGLRKAGYNDPEIGRAFGVSRQAVQQRFPATQPGRAGGRRPLRVEVEGIALLRALIAWLEAEGHDPAGIAFAFRSVRQALTELVPAAGKAGQPVTPDGGPQGGGSQGPLSSPEGDR